jgi:HEPN domain-containing protein
MKASTREWIKKAESDYQLAVSLTRRRKVLAHDHACFHFQQAAEKYLKARLEEAGVRFLKTHDIAALIQSAALIQPLWSAMIAAARRLNKFAVHVRYPGDDATAAEMRTAHADAKVIRQEARDALGL